MHSNYEDIKSRINELPKWYDSNGVPRYGKFDPEYCPDIYSEVVVLLKIACQDCGQQFEVELHSDFFSSIKYPKKLHYGDPPIHGCVGDTMNCNDLEVLEVWQREGIGDWTRRSKLEGKIE